MDGEAEAEIGRKETWWTYHFAVLVVGEEREQKCSVVAEGVQVDVVGDGGRRWWLQVVSTFFRSVSMLLWFLF